MAKVIVHAEVELGNEEMQFVEQALDEIINSLAGRAVVFEGQHSCYEEGFQKSNYQETIMDINGNSVGSFTLEVK